MATLPELCSEVRTALMTVRARDGHRCACPVATAECEPDGAVWLAGRACGGLDGLEGGAPAAVTWSRPGADDWVRVWGRAARVDDPDRAQALWATYWRAWFDGPDDPSLVLVRFEVDAVEVPRGPPAA